MEGYSHFEEPSRPRRVAGAVLGGAAGVVTAVVVLSFAALFNAGLAYRMDCAQADGTVASEWTYQWFAPIPFLLAPKKEGCKTYNGAHVLLSKIGVWSIPNETAGQIAVSTAADDGTAYYARIYEVQTQFAAAVKAKNRPALLKAVNDGATTFANLQPPPYVAPSHRLLRVQWAMLQRDLTAALRHPTASSSATLTADLASLDKTVATIAAAVANQRR